MCLFKLVVSYCLIVLDSTNKPRNSTQLIGHLVEKINFGYRYCKPRQPHRSFFPNLPRWKCISWSCSAASSRPCQMLADITDTTGSKLLRQSQNGTILAILLAFHLSSLKSSWILISRIFSLLSFLPLFYVQLQRGQRGTAAWFLGASMVRRILRSALAAGFSIHSRSEEGLNRCNVR